MAYNNVIDRSGAEALIPEEASREIIQNTPKRSAVMQLGRRLPNMSRAQRRMPVLSGLPTAYFVDGDTGLKQTSEVDWTNKYINAEELAVIVPIPESVLADQDYDIWGEVRPLIEEAFGVAFDAAVLFGTNAPASWPTNLKAGAVAAANNVALGTGADLYDDILSESGIYAKVEADGYMVRASIGALSMQGRLRGVRDANGQPIFMQSMRDPESFVLGGRPITFPDNGAFDASAALMFAGDWSQLVWAIRQEITYKVLDQAVIQDGAGNIVYNLAQQDMIALRAVMRLGWALPNPINRIQGTEASRYPFAVLTP